MMFAGELNIKPWEIGRLDWGQLTGAVAKFDEMIAADAERAASAK